MARKKTLAAMCAAFAVTTMTWGFGGPDLVICRIGGTNTTSGFSNLTSGSGVNGFRAFSADSVVCNYGNAQCAWDAGLPEPDNNHPVISQTLYRLRNGRLIQIGQSWAKHGGNATNQPECGLTCSPSGTSSILGIGCCDAYNALTNGTQFVGPKSEVNPYTGYFPYPFCSPKDGGMTCPPTTTAIDRRLQVADADIDTTTAGVQYFMQIHIITPDEVLNATPRTDDNNCSYRPLAFAANHNISAWTGVTVASTPVIKAWKLNGLGPGIADPDVVEAIIDVPGDGRFYLAAKASRAGAGLWQYEYAVQNYNSDRAAGSFSLPLPVGTALQSVFFRDIDSHSGEPYSNTDWPFTTTPTSIRWATEPHATNPNANSLRWDTLYNFRFQCNMPPASRPITLGFFKPGGRGAPASMMVMLPGPDRDCNGNLIADSVDIANATSQDLNADGVPDECQSACPADIVQTGTVNSDDLIAVISSWGTCPSPANCPADVVPPARDGLVNTDDLLLVITSWGACPAP